jgi:hypothetical protein
VRPGMPSSLPVCTQMNMFIQLVAIKHVHKASSKLR